MSLKILYVSIGQPLSIGGFHPIIIEVVDVEIRYGTERFVGLKHELMNVIAESSEFPLILRDSSLNL